MKKIYLAFLFFAANYSFAQTTVTLQPDSNNSEYATITTQFPTDQYPDRNVFQCSAWTISGTPYLWNSLLRFDLASIPSNAIIDSAFISLYGYIGPYDYHSALSGSNDSRLVRITSAWNEVSVTWNTQPTTTNVDSVYLPMSNTPGEDFLNYNIKNMVQYWVSNPANNFGLMYKLNNEQYYRRMSFHSPVSDTASKHPKLVITYHLPIENCINLILQPDSLTGKDTEVKSYYPTTVLSNDTDIDAWAWTIGGVADTQRVLLQFDLTSIPAGAIIQSANITLYHNPYSMWTHSPLTHTNASWLQRIISSWNENTVTWNNQPATTTLHEAVLPEDTDSVQDYTVDVTALVQDMVDNPASSFGFMLRMQVEQYYCSLIFSSSNNPNPALHPKLEICYTSNISVPEVSAEGQIKVYPNPSSGSFIVAFQNELNNGTIEVFNSLSQEVYKRYISESRKEEINLNAGAGIYFVKIYDGENSFTKKLIIE